MSITSREASNPNGTRLNALLVDAGLEPVRPELALSFDNYLSLLLRWNERVNLTAIRDIEGILSRHFVESIVCARALPDETTTLLDFGSGAGFPGIPIALCRPEIAVTLAESQGKKAAFLREAVRVLGITTKVHSARAEALPIQFDCVTLRAVDQMETAMRSAIPLIRPGGCIVLMTTGKSLERIKNLPKEKVLWHSNVQLLDGEDRLIALGKRL